MELYIHIPFCIRKCDYCDFLSGPASLQEQDRYMEALLREVQLEGSLRGADGPVTSLFIGGGTPSAISPDWIVRLMETVQENFTLAAGAEISMEANPGTLNREKLLAYRRSGINRLSIGLQSADNARLKTIGRIHTWEEFRENYSLAREVGFDNINIDLMSALPGQTVTSYEETLNQILALEPEHISAYSLIIEEGTPFWQRYADHPELLPSEEEDRQMYHLTKKLLGQAGYERYEISNYARPGFACRHNVGYWKRIPYLGMGLGASSFYKGERFSNTRQREKYLQLLDETFSGGVTFADTGARSKSAGQSDRNAAESARDRLFALREQTEPVTRTDAMEEFMFLGLRLTAGICSEDFRQEFGRTVESVYGPVLEKSVREGLLQRTESGYCFTEWGLDVSNHVLADFLLDEEP